MNDQLALAAALLAIALSASSLLITGHYRRSAERHALQAANVRALHRKASHGLVCVYCAPLQRIGYDATWPCDTIRALDDPVGEGEHLMAADTITAQIHCPVCDGPITLTGRVVDQGDGTARVHVDTSPVQNHIAQHHAHDAEVRAAAFTEAADGVAALIRGGERDADVLVYELYCLAAAARPDDTMEEEQS